MARRAVIALQGTAACLGTAACSPSLTGLADPRIASPGRRFRGNGARHPARPQGESPRSVYGRRQRAARMGCERAAAAAAAWGAAMRAESAAWCEWAAWNATEEAWAAKERASAANRLAAEAIGEVSEARSWADEAAEGLGAAQSEGIKARFGAEEAAAAAVGRGIVHVEEAALAHGDRWEAYRENAEHERDRAVDHERAGTAERRAAAHRRAAAAAARSLTGIGPGQAAADAAAAAAAAERAADVHERAADVHERAAAEAWGMAGDAFARAAAADNERVGAGWRAHRLRAWSAEYLRSGYGDERHEWRRQCAAAAAGARRNLEAARGRRRDAAEPRRTGGRLRSGLAGGPTR